MTTIAAMSSRGQIVLPIAIRRKLRLNEGAQFLVITDNENILLKPVREPSLDEFYSLIEQAQETARQIGLTEEDIKAAIKEVRAESREQEMRVVIDTNIVASAVYFGGKPYQFLHLLMEGKIDVVASDEIVKELKS